MIDEALVEAAEKMDKAAARVTEEFAAVRTGRATPALVDKIRVDYFGTDTPLQQLAGFTVPEARVLVISPYDKSTIKMIEKAITNSDLGVNPSNDGNIIRLTFPALTQDRRKDLVKVVKSKAEDGKVAVRNVRRDTRQKMERAEKDGTISSDDLKRAEKDLDKLTESHIAGIDKHLVAKEQELLEV
jgi:ribosome recycling factor